MESINAFWAGVGEAIQWVQTENPLIVLMTIIGCTVSTIAVYMIISYVIPAIVSVVIKKVLRRVDRFFYVVRKEHGRKLARQDGEPRVIQTLTGNLNGSR